MLIPKQAQHFSHRRERRLWHEDRHTPSLGCVACPERSLCGGLRVEAALFSCLDYCCGRPETCDTVCRNNPDFPDRVREVLGFDLRTVPHTPVLEAPPLPLTVPLIFHGKSRTTPLDHPTIALQLYQVISRRTGLPKYNSRVELCRAFQISPESTIILTGTASDPPLERWWQLSSGRRSAIQALRELGVALVTTPNFSLFSDQPRWDDLHSMKRILIVWHEFVEEGLPAALHVNARTEKDWFRWTTLIGERPEITHLAYEFGTGGGWAGRIGWHVDQLIKLAEAVHRPLHLIIRGGIDFLSPLATAYAGLTVLETSVFMKTINRRRAVVPLEGGIRWEPAPTEAQEPLDHLLRENCDTVNRALGALAGESPLQRAKR